MADLLQIGGITEAMRTRLSDAFNIHRRDAFDADAITHIVTNGHDGAPADLMASLPNLKVISVYGVGYDAVDANAAASRGVIVTHTPDVLNQEVATTAVLLMLSCYRELVRDDAFVRAGYWESNGNAPLTRSADEQKVGILGLGRIGQAIARKLGPWNPEISYHTRSKKDVPYKYFDNLIAMAHHVDVLICITPGGSSTDKLVNEEVIEALGPRGTLINVSRGSVVDEPALIAALQGGKLGWAGLDVFRDEPRVPQALRDLPNVVLLPHAGSATVETRAAMGNLTVDNLLQHLNDGTVLTPVPECKDL
ncbi:2-hydroxyacid dehydrogenase [Ruegeria meonggei]|uniref:Glyoxylate/hydroxypyruvate reductase B n=1 Tax=Ruegeria meonggei TaxID=1446476 RepID=A0A1X6YVG8_9RHOB|nr:2-hydroxyacid dehydrogenase [Ruegeria meonggei]SLN32065.1 Glyoxylate/hydroxypyruvate reductase B [Ruegeria meonggei]